MYNAPATNAKKIGLDYVYVGNMPAEHMENTYCHKCNELVIERVGYSIISMNLDKGNCAKCNEKIPGRY